MNVFYQILDWIAFFTVLPYFRIYRRNTKEPIQAISQERDPEKVQDAVQEWLRIKTQESKYVQVAGAVMFTSVIGCLSWSNLSGRHWIGPAFWYASIGLAITSVVLAAQQMLVIDTVQLENSVQIRKRLVYEDASGQDRPRRIMLHVWQVPTECLSYSISCFMVGLMSHVYSPVAQNMAWDNDAKTAIVFSVAIIFIAMHFVLSSSWVHHIAD